MNKNFLYSTAILLASLTLEACSSDDDNKLSGYTVETVSQPPTWQIDWQSDDARPDWQDPNIQDYENWSIMKVQVEDVLKPYTSSDDLMALFVSGECRGVQGPAFIVGSSETNTTTYLLKAWGNEKDGDQLSVTLKYYSARLKQVFARSTTVTYRVGQDIGVDTDLIPQFTLGSSKYPVVMTFDASALLTKASITPASGDLMSAFVAAECRGVSSSAGPLTVFGHTEGESITVKYYQAVTGSIYTFPDAAKTVRTQ